MRLWTFCLDWSFWSPQVPVVSSLVGQRVPVKEELGEPTHVSVVRSLSPPLWFIRPPGPWAEVEGKGLERVRPPDVRFQNCPRSHLLQGTHLRKASGASSQVCGLPRRQEQSVARRRRVLERAWLMANF